MAKERARYSNWVKQQVKLRYPGCRTTEDKRQLALELGILDTDGQPSVPKLYNLASRLGATGRDDSQANPAAAAAHDDRLKEREDPENTVFSREAERYLRSEFGRRPIEWIAMHLRHTETAVAYYARQLGLRKPVKYWNARKVAYWLGVSVEELHALRNDGIDIYPQHDVDGHLQLEVVSTTSLARWLKDERNAGAGARARRRRVLPARDHRVAGADHRRRERVRAVQVPQPRARLPEPVRGRDQFRTVLHQHRPQQSRRRSVMLVRDLAIGDLRPDN